MKSKLVLTTALCGIGFAASAQEIVVMSWGDAYTRSQVEAYHKPFTEATGIRVISVDADNPATPLKAQVEAGNVSVDVADVELSDAIRLCDEGLLEVIDLSILPDGADGTPAEEDFLEGALFDCGVANIVWSTIVAYNTNAIESLDSISALFDTETYPGRRGLRRSAKANLEMALMADGVPAAEVYDLLRTPEGVDRAFAKLDTIKSDIVWWEAGAQPAQLLSDGEVVMSVAYNGRIFAAQIAENQPFGVLWDGQILELDLFVIPRGAPNLDAALEFVKFATETEQLANQAQWISYGPARLSSAPFVGLYQDGVTEMAPHMPTSPENLGNALLTDVEFWADHDVELSERFNAWVAG